MEREDTRVKERVRQNVKNLKLSSQEEANNKI